MLTLKEAAISLYTKNPMPLSISEMAQLIIINPEFPKIELKDLKKKLSISTTKWEGFTRTKVDKVVKVNYSLEANVEAPVTQKDPQPIQIYDESVKIGDEIRFLYDGQTLKRKISFISKDLKTYKVSYKGSVLAIKASTVL